jgi:hypothetical protein
LELLLIWFLLFKIRSEEDRRKIADYRIQIRLKEKRKKNKGGTAIARALHPGGLAI